MVVYFSTTKAARWIVRQAASRYRRKRRKPLSLVKTPPGRGVRRFAANLLTSYYASERKRSQQKEPKGPAGGGQRRAQSPPGGSGDTLQPAVPQSALLEIAIGGLASLPQHLVRAYPFPGQGLLLDNENGLFKKPRVGGFD